MEPISTLGTWIDDAPWKTRNVSLILIGPNPAQAHTLAGKRQLIQSATPGVLLAAWHGTYRTDLRLIDDETKGAVKDALN